MMFTFDLPQQTPPSHTARRLYKRTPRPSSPHATPIKRSESRFTMDWRLELVTRSANDFTQRRQHVQTPRRCHHQTPILTIPTTIHGLHLEGNSESAVTYDHEEQGAFVEAGRCRRGSRTRRGRMGWGRRRGRRRAVTRCILAGGSRGRRRSTPWKRGRGWRMRRKEWRRERRYRCKCGSSRAHGTADASTTPTRGSAPYPSQEGA
jgi:hypothetical protein